MARPPDPDGPIPCGCGSPLRRGWGKICCVCGCQFCSKCIETIGGRHYCPGCVLSLKATQAGK
jgi:hypothetical protein